MGDRLYLERFVWLDSQVRKGRYPNATGLAREFECSVKTAQRTIETFRWFGASLDCDASRRGYRYGDPDYRLPVTRLSETELLALLVSRKLLADAAAGLLGDELGRVANRPGRLLTGHVPGLLGVSSRNGKNRTLSRFDFRQKVRVAIKHFEEFHECQGRFGLAFLVARECIDATAENLPGFALVKSKFFAHSRNECRVNDGSIHLLVELQHQRTDTRRFFTFEYAFAASRAEPTRYFGNRC
jgi:hypothetical protein